MKVQMQNDECRMVNKQFTIHNAQCTMESAAGRRTSQGGLKSAAPTMGRGWGRGRVAAAAVAALCLAGAGTSAWGAITESFDSWPATSSGWGAYDKTYNNNSAYSITVASVRRSGATAKTGSALNFASSATAKLTAYNSSSGVGTIAFWHRGWNTKSYAFTVYASVSGMATWSSSAVSITAGQGNSSWYSFTWNPALAGSNARVTIARNAGERFFIDEFNLSDAASAATAEVKWLANSYIVLNGSWYNGSGSGNTALPSTLGAIENLSIGGEIQNWVTGNAQNKADATLNYQIDSGEWTPLAMKWYKKPENNNYYHTLTSGSDMTAQTVDISGMAAGTHTLKVYFSQDTSATSVNEPSVNGLSGGKIFDSNGGDDYEVSFTIAATLSRTPTSLSGFSTVAGTASEAKSFSVTATHLNGNLTVTPPTGYEVSTTSATDGFESSKTLSRDANNKVTGQTVYVRLKSSASAGTYNGNVSITGGGTSGTTVALTGSVAAAVPEIDVESSHAFGTMTAGQSKTETITVRNTGTGPLTISGVTFSGTGNGYCSVSPTTATVAAGGSQNLSVTFAPTAAGSYSVTMNIANNDSDENPKAVTLTATVAPVAPGVTLSSSTAKSITGSVTGIESGATVTLKRYTSSSDASGDTGGTVVFSEVVNATSKSFTDTGLDGCSTYYYRAWQTRNSQTSEGTATAASRATSDVAGPTLEASGATANSITVNWSAADGATGYKVQVASGTPIVESAAGGSRELFNNPAAAPSPVPDGWTYTSVNTGGSYVMVNSSSGYIESPTVDTRNLTALEFTCLARTYGGESGSHTTETITYQYSDNGGTTWSGWTSIGSISCSSKNMTAKNANFAAAIGHAQVKFRWTNANADGSHGVGMNSMVLTGTSEAVTGNVVAESATLGEDATSWTTPATLSEGVTYYYRVQAIGGGECSAWSSVGEQQTSAANTAPSFSPSTDVTGTATVGHATQGTYTYSRKASGYPAPTHSVALTSGTLGSGTYSIVGSGEHAGDFTFTPALAGTYVFTVTANNGVGSPATYTITVTVKPAALTLTAAQGATPGTVTLTVGGAETGASVNVRRYESSSAASSDTTGTSGTQVTAANANGTFTDSGLDGCTTYYYKAWQTHNDQTSAATDTKDAKTKLAAPEVWSLSDDGSIELNWPPVKGAEDYTVEIATDDTFATGSEGTLLSMDFEDSTDTTGWTMGGSSNSDHAQSGKCRQLTASAEIVTPVVNNPAQISFYVNMSSGGKNKTYYVYYAAPDDEEWSNSMTFTTESSAKTVTLDFPANVGEVEICIASEYSSIYIDDLVVTGSAGGGTMMAGYPATVAQVAAGVTNVSHTLSGLTNGVTYSYRVTANGAESCETPSSIGHEEPTAATPTMGVTVGGSGVAYDGTVAFGNVGVGSPQTKTFTVANTGSGTLTLGSVGVTADRGFTVTGPADGSVAGSGSTTFTVTFTPTVAMIGAGQKSATVSFTHNDGEKTTPYRFTVTASATGGILAVDESAGGLAFGNTPLDSPKTETVTIRNTGNVALTVGSVSVSGTGFSLVSAWSSQSIAAGGSATVSVRFAPASAGSKSGTLTVTASGAASGSPATVELTGTGLNETTGNIWIKPLTTGNQGTKTVGDTMGEHFLNFEIGQESWNKSEVGIGLSTGTVWGDFNWADAGYYEEGEESGNKRVRRDLAGFQFTQAGQYNVIYAAKASASDNSTVRCAGGWVNYTTWLPTDFGATYFTVEPVPDPAVTSATAGYETVALRWSLDAASHPVMIVRYTGATPTVTAPTPGEHYESGAPIGAGTVVYREWAGTSVDTAVAQGTTYTYVLYSVNNGYYSAGAQTTVMSSSVSTPSVTVTDAGSGTLTGGDSGVTYVVARNTTGTFDTNPTGSGPSQGGTLGTGANAATVVYRGTAATFADTTVVGCNTYYYKVWAKAASEDAWSAGSGVANATMATPAAPVLNALSGITYQGFTASWNAVPGAATYRMDVAKSFAGTVTETFNDADLGSGTVSSYIDRTITGGVMGTWTATQCRIDQTSIDGKAPTIGAGGTLVSSPLTSRCSEVSFQYAWPFSESGTVTIKLYADDVEVGSQDISASAGGTATFTGLNIAAGAVVKFENTATSSKRMLMDNITFSCSADYVTGWENKDVGNVTSVNVSGLEELTTYYVRVKAQGSSASCTSVWSNVQSARTLENDTVTSVTIANYDAAGASAGSNVADGAVAAGQTVLVQGTKLTVAAGSVNPVLTGVTFATTGTATGSDVGTVRVRVGTSSTYAGTETALGTAVTYTGAGTYTASGSQSLTPGTTYYVWIEAVTAAGAAGGSTVKVGAMTTDSFAITNGRKSGSTTAAGTQTIGNLTAFSAAEGATAGGQVDLTWTAGASGTLTVRWSDVSLAAIPDPGSAAEAGKEATGLTGGSYAVTGLTGCKTYYFKAWEVVGGTACGGVRTGTASASQPGAPTAPLTGTAGDAHSATLSWGAAAGASGYSVDVWHYSGGSGGGGGSGSGGIAGTYTRITAAGQLEAGNYVIVATNKAEGLAAMRNTIGGTSTKYIECEEDVSDDKTTSSLTITAENADIVWNLAYDGETETWSFRNAAWNEGTGGYAGYPESGNSGNIYDTLDIKSRWKMGVSGGLWAVTNVNVTNRLLQYNAGSPRFACYTGGQGALMLFKQQGGGGGGGGGSGTPIPDVTANVPQTVGGTTRTISFPTETSASVGNLDEGTTYYWSVTATGSGGCEGGSADGPSFATTELLGAPTVAAYTGLGGGQVTGTVTRASADATVLLKRYESATDADNDRNGHEVSTTATATATLVTFDDSGLAGCKTYWYKARQTDTVTTLEGEVEATSAWSTPASADATLGAPVMDPDPPVGAGTSLTLAWQPVAGASYYTVLVSDTENTWTHGTSGATELEEDFAGFTESANTDLAPGIYGSSITSTYTHVDGWYGRKVYCTNLSGNACAKLGSGSTNGFITTPGIEGGLSAGGKLYFDVKRFGTDGGTLDVQICYDDGDDDDDNDEWTILKEVEPPAEWQGYSVDLAAGSTTFWICFETTAKRAYLDNVRIVSNGSGSGGSIKYEVRVSEPPFERTADGLTVNQTYWYMVTAWSDGGCTNATGGSATLANVPLIQVRPKEYDFGTVDKSTTATHDFTVKNTGSQTMSISAISIDPDEGVTAYTITAIGDRTEPANTMSDSTGWTLAPNASLTVTVQFKPWRDGERDARLRIRSNAYNANGEDTSSAVYGDWDVDLTGDCHDPSSEPVSVYRLEVTDGMGVMNTIADHSLALGTADGTGGELPGALQPTLSVLAWQYNGLDTTTARWTLKDPNGDVVEDGEGHLLSNQRFDSATTVQHGGKPCTNFTVRIPTVGVEGAVRGTYTVLFTVNDTTGDHGVTAVDKFTPPEKGWLLEDFTRADREATGGGALENGWTVTATDGEPGSAVIHADQLELYGPNGEMSGDSGRVSVVRDMGDLDYEKYLEDMPSTVSWGFHFKTRANTTGWADRSTAGAFVLGATSADWFGTGTTAAGYAVMMMNNTVTLATFSGGLASGGTRTTLAPADTSKPFAYTNTAGKTLAVRVDFVPAQEYIEDVQEAVPARLKLYVAEAGAPGGNPLDECEEEHLVCTVAATELLGDNLQYAGMVWNHGQAQLSDKTGCAFDDLYFPNEKGQKEPMQFHVIDEDTDAPEIFGLDLPTAVAVGKLLSGGSGLTVTGMVYDASGVWARGTGTTPQAELLVNGTNRWTGTPTVTGTGTNATLSVTIAAGEATGLTAATVTTNCALVLTICDRDHDRAGDGLATVSTNWFTLCDSQPAAPAWATVEGDGAETAVLRWKQPNPMTDPRPTWIVVRSDTEFGERATPPQGTKTEPAEKMTYDGLGTVVYKETGDTHLTGDWTAREFIVEPGSTNYFAVYGMTGNDTTGFFFSEPTRPTAYHWATTNAETGAVTAHTATNASGMPVAGSVSAGAWPLVTATYEPGEGVDAFAYRTSVTSPDDTNPAVRALPFNFVYDAPRPETGSGWSGSWAGDTGEWKIHDVSLTTGGTHYPAASGNKLFWEDSHGGTEYTAKLTRTLGTESSSGSFFFAALLNFRIPDGANYHNKWANIALMSGETELVSFGKQGGSNDSEGHKAAIYTSGPFGNHYYNTTTETSSGYRNGTYDLNSGHGSDYDYVIVGQVDRENRFLRMWVFHGNESIPEIYSHQEGGAEVAQATQKTALNTIRASCQWDAGTTVPGITAIRLQAGSKGSETMGHVYFDEIRFAGSWEELFLFNAPEVFTFDFELPLALSGIMVGTDDEGHRQWKISDGALAHGDVGLNAQFGLFHRTGIQSASFTILDEGGTNLLKTAASSGSDTTASPGAAAASVPLTGTRGASYSDWGTTDASGAPGGAVGVAIPTNWIALDSNYVVEVTLRSTGGKEATVTSASESGGNSATDLFIGEYGEGSYWDKYIELYNGTGHEIDLYNYYIFRPKKNQTWGDYSSLIPDSAHPFVRLAQTPGTNILQHKETIVLLNRDNPAQRDSEKCITTNATTGVVTTNTVSFTAADRLAALEAGLTAAGARYQVMPDEVLNAGGDVPYLLIAATNFNESVVTNAAKNGTAVSLTHLDACGLASLVFEERSSERYIMSRKDTAQHLPRPAPLTIDPSEWDYRDWGWPKSNWRFDDYLTDFDENAVHQDDLKKYTNVVATAGQYDRNIGLGGHMEFMVYDDDEAAPTLAPSGHGVDLGSGVTVPTTGTKDLVLAGWSFTNVEAEATAADVAAVWSGSAEASSARLTCSDNLGSVERLVEKGEKKGVAGVLFNGTPQAQNGDLYFACNDEGFNITAEDDVWIGFETDMENMTDRKVNFWYASGSGGFKAGHVEVLADGGTWLNPEGWTLAFDEAEGTGGADTFTEFEGSLEFTKADGTTPAIPRETRHVRFRVHLSGRKAATGTFRMDAIQVHGNPLEVVVTDEELLNKQPTFQATLSDEGSGLDLSSATFSCGVGSNSMLTTAADLTDGGRRPSALQWQTTSTLDKAGVQAWYEASEASPLHLRVSVNDADDDRVGDQLGMTGHFGVLRVIDDDAEAPVMAATGNGVDIDGTLAEPEEGSTDLVVAGWSFTNTTSAAAAMEVWSGSAVKANAALSCCEQLGTVASRVVPESNKGVSGVEFNGTTQLKNGELYFTCANAGDEPDVWVGFEMDMMAMTDREVSFWYAGGDYGFGSGWVEYSADNGATWTKPDGWDLVLPTGGASTFSEFAQSLDWEEGGELVIPRSTGHLMFRVHVAKGVSSTASGTFRMDCMQVHGKPSEVTVTDHDLVGKTPAFKAKISDPGSGLDTTSLTFSYGDLSGISAVTVDTSKLVNGGKGAASELSWTVSTALSTDEVHQWYTNAAAGETLLKVSVKDNDDDRTDDQLQLDGPIGVLRVVDDDAEPPEIVMKSMKPRTGGVLGEWFFESKDKANQGASSIRANGLSAGELRARTGNLEPTLPHADGSVYDGAGAGDPPGFGAWQMGWHGGNKYWYVRLETLVETAGTNGATFTVTNISFNSKVNQMKGPTACMPVLLQGVTSINANDKALEWVTSNRLSGASGASLLPSGSAWTADTVKTWKSVSVSPEAPIVLGATSVNELQLWGMGAATNGSLARWTIHDLKIEGIVQYANGLSEEVTYVTDHALATGSSVGNLRGNAWDESGLSSATYRMEGWSESRALTFTEGEGEQSARMAAATNENAGAFSAEMSEIPVTYTGLTLQDYRGTVEVWDADADRTSGDGTVNEDCLKVEGEFGFTVIDQDVVEPTAPTDIAGSGVTLGEAPERGTAAWNNAPWTNNPEFLVTFTPAEDIAPTVEELSGDDYGAFRTAHELEQVSAGQAAHQLVATGIGEYRVAAATDAASLADAPAFSVAAVQGAIANYGFERGNKDTAAADTGWTNPDGSSGIHKGNNVGGSYPVAEGTNSYYLREFGNGAIASQIIPFAASESAQTVTVSLSMKIFKRAEGSKLHAKFEFSADGTSWSQAHDEQLTVGTATDAHNTWLTKTLAATELTAAAGAKYLRFSVYSDGGGANIDDVRLSVRVGEAPAAGTPDTATMRYEAEQGLATKHLFAVDADNDRRGDRRTGGSVAFYTAYDCTPPTPVALVVDSEGHHNAASTDSVDDPMSQFDVTWVTDGVGPDDPEDGNHPTKDENDTDYLSPWLTYKFYCGTHDPEADTADWVADGRPGTLEDWLTERYITSGAYTNWGSITNGQAIEDPSLPAELKKYSGLDTVAEPPSAGTTARGGRREGEPATRTTRLYDLENDQDYIVVVVGVDKAGNEGPANANSWATNNTIKFAITQGVIRARSAINAAVGALVDGTATNTVGMAKITGDNAPDKGAVLYWMAAGMKDGEGKVSKYYDLIYRDEMSFNELGNETWYMAGTNGGNSGTSKTNWNYQAEDFSGLGRGKLRFYRASYTGRWNPPGGGLPLASEEVYSMNRVPLLEGVNLVGLQGVPYTNTLRGLLGMEWPLPRRSDDATRVEFFRYADGALVSATQFWFRAAIQIDTNGVGSTNTTRYWASGANSTNDISDAPLSADYFGRAFSITLPELAGDFREFETNVVVTAYMTTNGEEKAFFTNKLVGGMSWYPMLQVPTNGPVRLHPDEEGWYEQSGTNVTKTKDAVVVHGKTYYTDQEGKTVADTSADGSFRVEVAYGNRRTGARYTLVNLNLPVAVEVGNMKLLECGFQPRTGTNPGDIIYTYDNEKKAVKNNSLIYYDGSQWKNAYGTGGTKIYPNEAIVIWSQGAPSGKTSWTWTYRPSDFYELPTRHMGRGRTAGE